MSKENNNYSIAGRYRTVRKHLDDLGYNQALSLDSLPLIELLLVDLAQTKESLKHYESVAKDNLQACSQLQIAIDPYKCDNARLVQECNQIHLELIEAKEANQKQSNDYKKRIRKLESELTDLQLSFSKNLQRIKQLETESSNKSKKILELQGKCCKPIVNNANLATKKRASYPLRRPALEAESFPRSSSTSTTSFSTRSVEPYVVDFVSMADHRVSCLNKEVTKLKEDLFLHNEHIETLKSQLNSKEKEISRLRKLLEGGRPCTSINKDHCCLRAEKSNGYQRDSDNEELLRLQQAKLNLEQQLKEALNKQHDAMAQAMKLAERNESLEKELKDVDRIALAVEADCNSTVKENNRRVCRLQEKLEDVMTQVHVLESELTVQRREAQELRADLEACRIEKTNVQRVLETTLEEKKQMTDRINNLTIMESTLNDKIIELREENERQKSKISDLEKNNENLTKKTQPKEKGDGICPRFKEKQGKAETFVKNIANKRNLASKSEPDNSKESSRRKEANNESRNTMDKLIHDKNVIIESLQNTIERIETERDHYKSEYGKFKDQLKKDFEKDNNESVWSQVCELRAQLSEKDHALSKLLREKKQLCQEKFNLENKLHSIEDQRGRSSPCDCRTPPLSERKSLAVNCKMERLERERDAAKADVERLIEERDTLHERLKLATEAHVSEQRRLRESLEESESRLCRIEREHRELLIVQEGRRAAISGLDEQIEDLKEELRRTKQELSEQRTQYFQLRALQDQTDQALGDVQGQLTQTENELTGALDRNKNLERQQLQLDNQIKELRQEINTHRSRMSQLDREKDQLLMDLDERTEKIAALERELVFKEQQMNNMEQQVRELSHTKSVSIEQASDLDRQMRSMQLDMDNLQRQLSSATLDRENVIQENRRLQDDLAAVSCEVRRMHKELEATKAEAHDLKRQLQTYVSEVRRAEELLSQKENERTEMLNHFRSLSLEATVLENNNHSLESEAAEARGALQAARDQICDMERQLSDKDCLVRGYEQQISELTQNIASLEIQLQQATDERMRIEEDLRTVRDLCMTLEQQKDCISKRLDENTELKTQYEMQLARFRSEQEIFQDQMNKDHVMIDRLEKLLEETRKETITSQTNSRELQCEVSRLKQKISEMQNKLSTETSEVRKYQAQTAEYSKQISELRRQVTNERFERARIQDENQSQNASTKQSGCQTELDRSQGCQCPSKRSTTPNATSAGSCQQSNRYDKALVPKAHRSCAVQSSDDEDVNQADQTACACGNVSSGTDANSNSDKCKITELPSTCAYCGTTCNSSNNKMVQRNNLIAPKNTQLHHNIMNYQTASPICYCGGKTKIGDIISNKNIECKAVNVQNDLARKSLNNKTALNSGVSSEAFLQCGRCGGTKKTVRQTCVRNSSPYWIVDCLNFMHILLEEKKRARARCKCCEVAVQVTNKDECARLTQTPDDKATQLPTEKVNKCKEVKYSLIKASRSPSNVSTQTQESVVTIASDCKGTPQLLHILTEIQQYAKSIKDCYQMMNESKNYQRKDEIRETGRQKSMRTGALTLLPTGEKKVQECQRDVPETSQQISDVSLPMEMMSRCSLEEAQETCSYVSISNTPPFTSTPRSSQSLPDSMADTSELLNVPPIAKNGRTNSDLGSSVYLGLPREPSLTQMDGSDFNSTEYLQLPRLNGRISSNLDEAAAAAGPSNLVVNLREQVNEVYVDMETLQEKIERLRRDIFMDSEEVMPNKRKGRK